MTTSHDVGTIQYIEWLLLINRVQPSFIAGVVADIGMVCMAYLTGRGVCIRTPLPVRYPRDMYMEYLTGRGACLIPLYLYHGAVASKQLR